MSAIDWEATALIFPGQGSQMVGMGKDVAQAYPPARRVFEQADALMGRAFADLCWHGPEGALNKTANTQPALYVTSMAIFAALAEAVPQAARPAFMAGHSLGEFTALACAGAMSFEDGLRVVVRRGELMRDAGESAPGAMAAVLGMEAHAVREVCARTSEQTGGVLVLANDNCPGQVVISGDVHTLERGIENLTAAGARRVVKLAVSVAAHSPLMSPAALELMKATNAIHLGRPRVPVIANVNARPLQTAMDIRLELEDQLTQPVRWTESVRLMIAEGVTHFIEIGSGEVLSGLVKRIDSTVQRTSLRDADSLRAFIAAHKTG